MNEVERDASSPGVTTRKEVSRVRREKTNYYNSCAETGRKNKLCPTCFFDGSCGIGEEGKVS